MNKVAYCAYRKMGQVDWCRSRIQCVSNPNTTVLVTCFRQGELVGHAFASVWDIENGKGQMS